MRPVQFVTSFALSVLCLAAILMFGCTQQLTVEACEKKTVEYGQRDQCFRCLAKATNDTQYCGRIDDSILRDYWCYREIAYCTRNNALCGSISDADARQSCYDVVAGTRKFEGGRENPCLPC